jgi:hypothetical protein
MAESAFLSHALSLCHSPSEYRAASKHIAPNNLVPLLLVVRYRYRTIAAVNFLSSDATNRGILSITENHMKKLPFVFGFILWANATHAQIVTGTVVVYELTKGKFVIAADSRGGNRDEKTMKDSYCKISAFEPQHVVFAASGSAMALGTVHWDAWSEAKHSVDSKVPDGIDPLDWIANSWANATSDFWLKVDHRIVEEDARKHSGLLVTGIFARADQGRIEFCVRGIRAERSQLWVDKFNSLPHCVENPCASGQDTVFLKYTQSGKDYLKASPAMLKTYGDGLLRVVKLAELTALEDTTGSVHGPIDALELKTDGTIVWYRKKKNCAQTSN